MSIVYNSFCLCVFCLLFSVLFCFFLQRHDTIQKDRISDINLRQNIHKIKLMRLVTLCKAFAENTFPGRTLLCNFLTRTAHYQSPLQTSSFVPLIGGPQLQLTSKEADILDVAPSSLLWSTLPPLMKIHK